MATLKDEAIHDMLEKSTEMMNRGKFHTEIDRLLKMAFEEGVRFQRDWGDTEIDNGSKTRKRLSLKSKITD